MSIGPVEYATFSFPGNKFKGEIVPALSDLVKSGTIRIIDIAIVVKDADGNVGALELADLDSEVFQLFDALDHEVGGLLSEDDLKAAQADLKSNSSAALLVWEDVWATKLRDAILAAGGEIVTLDRLPRDVVQAAIDFAEMNK